MKILTAYRRLTLAVVLVLSLLSSPTLAEAADNPARLIDIATLTPGPDPLTRVYGPPGVTTFGFFGVPVAGGGDVDGDGHGDLAVAHMTATYQGRFFSGQVLLVFGDGTIGHAFDADDHRDVGLRIAGDGLFEDAGSEIWMGDVTGDGLAELIICRQNFTYDGRLGAGGVTLVIGSPALREMAEEQEILDLRSPPEDVTLFTLAGAAANDRLGIWARVGDVDGDRVDDLIVAADQASLPDELNRGEVYVVRGGEHLAVDEVVDLAEFGSTALVGRIARVVPPPGSGDYHLGSTNQAGDLDGNGKAEVMIAAALNRAGAVLSADGMFTGDAVGGPPGGQLWVLWDDAFPEGDWPAGFEIDLGDPPASTTVISGPPVSASGVTNAAFGEEILGGLDYDGDGHAELFVGDLIGDATEDRSRPVSGVGYVFYHAAELRGLDFAVHEPPDGVELTTILGPTIGAISSDTVAHGDFDGDGTGDLLLGSPHDSPQGRFQAGSMHILLGREGGWPERIDLQPGALPPVESVEIVEVHGARGAVFGPPPDFPILDTGDTLCYSAAAGGRRWRRQNRHHHQRDGRQRLSRDDDRRRQPDRPVGRLPDRRVASRRPAPGSVAARRGTDGAEPRPRHVSLKGQEDTR